MIWQGWLRQSAVLLCAACLYACDERNNVNGSKIISDKPSVSDSNNTSVEQPIPPASPIPPPTASLDDPLYIFQWHLKNNSGIDINIESVWSRAIKGQGILIAIVDDGFDVTHEDLKANVSLAAGHAYGNATPSIQHGTAVAGLVAAVQRNGLGGRGVAPAASIASYALTDNPSDLNIADAMMRDPNVAISNNSWSQDPDSTGELYYPSSLWRQALNVGVTTGRDGRGTIYVWAAGNGGEQGVDNSNYDGLTNARQVLAVCAVGDQGKRANYSESGANLWLCAPSWQGVSSAPKVTTTDSMGESGYNAGISEGDYADPNYTSAFAGTSAAAPIVSGAIALMLEANPSLSWRDVRLILAQTALRNDATDSDWSLTGGAPVYHVNHKYGFGTIDVDAAVTLAQTWVAVDPEQIILTGQDEPNKAIPDEDVLGVTSSITVVDDLSIEFIEVNFSAADHTHHGDLTVTLMSPTGTKSILAQVHSCYEEQDSGSLVSSWCDSKYDQWVFGVARHLGENARGVWTLRVADEMANDLGTFQSWSIRFFGH